MVAKTYRTIPREPENGNLYYTVLYKLYTSVQIFGRVGADARTP